MELVLPFGPAPFPFTFPVAAFAFALFEAALAKAFVDPFSFALGFSIGTNVLRVSPLTTSPTLTLESSSLASFAKPFSFGLSCHRPKHSHRHFVIRVVADVLLTFDSVQP